MKVTSDLAMLVVWGGFALAFVFGAVANRTNFCTMGAVSDIVNMGHWGRMRMWLLTIAVALVGTNLLQYAGLIDVSKSVYQRPTLNWLSLGLGGLLFGVGMTMAAGCANKNLVRLGAGSVRSLVVLTFMAISAYMTLKGLFALWRTIALDPVRFDLAPLGTKTSDLPSILAALGMGAYAASKAGMVGMSKSLAAEVASRNITVNCVAPGFITTAMTEKLTEDQKARILTQVPAGRMGEAAEIAAACLYLASPEAGYVTGTTLHVNGGMAMI